MAGRLPQAAAGPRRRRWEASHQSRPSPTPFPLSAPEHARERRRAAEEKARRQRGETAFDRWCQTVKQRPPLKSFEQPRPWRGVLDDDVLRGQENASGGGGMGGVVAHPPAQEKPTHFVGLPPRRRAADAIMMRVDDWDGEQAEPPNLWRSRREAEQRHQRIR